MCEFRNSTKAKIGKKKLRVDRCMARLMEKVNSLGLKTVACCCGHGRYPMTVIYEEGNKQFDLISGVEIKVPVRRYVSDEEGFMHIPVVTEQWERKRFV